MAGRHRHPLPEGDRLGRVVAGLRHEGQPEPVGLELLVAREGQQDQRLAGQLRAHGAELAEPQGGRGHAYADILDVRDPGGFAGWRAMT